MKILLALLLGCVAGCSSGEEAELIAGSVAQIDAPNCETYLRPETSECDADHLLVVRCGLPQENPSGSECAPAANTPPGLGWCCRPAFAETCGSLCPTSASLQDPATCPEKHCR